MKAILLWITSILCVGGAPLSEQQISQHQLLRFAERYSENTLATLDESSLCTKDNIAVRKEWETLSVPERQNFINALICIQHVPSLSGNPLAKSRYDDFLLTHINQTLVIHFSALLLPWHRLFINRFERALREECGYNGYLPYWNWSKYVQDNRTTTIFDGSPTSMSGNGNYVEHGPFNVTFDSSPLPRAYVTRPPGTGGGCVDSGPLANWNVHLGPVDWEGNTLEKAVIHDRPRCLARDFLFEQLESSSSYQKVADLISMPDIHSFHQSLEYGVHVAGHSFLGGDGGLDQASSANDPVFYLHHAMIDRTWSIWQSLDPAARDTALDGTLTGLNYPPSRNGTLEDWLLFPGLQNPTQIAHAMLTTRNGLCYMYN